MKIIQVQGPAGRSVQFANNLPLAIIAGPCAIESRAAALATATELKAMFDEAGIPFIYKSSFDKANRSSLGSFRGVGLDEGLSILAEVRETVGVPVLTDVHEAGQAARCAEVVDMLQTPAFLCRQTDFILDVARAGKPVNVKKGQFLSPWEMARVADKALSTGNTDISLCERGYMFGYNNLVVDMRSFSVMAETGQPVIFDATHSVQLPGGQQTCSGGDRRFVSTLARAAVAAGVAGLFIETHPDPDCAPCDGPNMVAFKDLPKLLHELKAIDSVVKSR